MAFQRILILKLSSLGDLIHLLPALSEAHRAHPSLRFDWVIDEQFQEVARWHPAVEQIFPTSHRRWRRALREKKTYQEIAALLRSLCKTRYDLILDAQGNFKTALLSLCLKGKRVGFDRHSVREWIAHFAYEKKIEASKNLHAIERLRLLFSQALDFPLSRESARIDWKKECWIRPLVPIPSCYLFFIPNASWQTKLWPEEHWKTLILKSVSLGFSILLPCGNEKERKRAERLVVSDQVHLLPRLSLSEIGYLLKGAKGVVSIDTGLSHLAAALEVPSIHLYGATDSRLTGAFGSEQMHFRSSLRCSPCQKKKCLWKADPALCMEEISPDLVFRRMMSHFSKQASNTCNNLSVLDTKKEPILSILPDTPFLK